MMIDMQNIKTTKIPLIVLYITLMVLMCTTSAQAAALRAVTVTLEGEPLNMLVPPVVVSGKTMVAVRSVGEAVGGTVEWDNAKQQATIKRYSDTIILTVGQKGALVNGKLVQLEVAPQVVNGRTMVPIRFIAEALGGTVEWSGETWTVNILRKPTRIVGMSYSDEVGKAKVTLTLSEPLLRSTPAVGGTTLNVSLYPAEIALGDADRRIYDSLLKQLRLQPDGRTVNLEAQLWYNPSYRLIPSADGKQLTIEFDHAVTALNFSQNGRIPSVTIGTTGKVAYNVLQLTGPPRLVVDIADAKLTQGIADSISVGSPYVQRIRTAPKADGVRVVFDMTENLPYDIVPTDSGLAVQFAPRLLTVNTERLDGKSRITFSGNLPMDAKVSVPVGQSKILIEVPQGRSELKESLIRLADGTIDSISVAPGAMPNSLLITISLPYYLGHTVVSKDGDKSIAVDIVSSPVFGKRIWLDAGHGKIPGGNDDPGSIGKFYKTYEKAINLQVALELQRKLQEAGAIVLMTRTGDEGPDFRDRPALVNAVKPPVDLFISIHHNAASIANVRGTETYYWTTNLKSKAAANAIHPALVKYLGFPDRGVRLESFYVIKETRAPSVLLELGYLSNQDEENAIAEPGVARKTYPARAAEGIKMGIFTYFWQEIQAGVAK